MDFNTSVAQPSPVALEIRPPQSQSPLEIAGQMQENRMRQQQLAAGAMENQQRQLDLQDQQTMRSMLPKLLGDPAYQSPEGQPDWNKVTQALAPHVSPKNAFSLQQTILGNQEKAANIQKTRAGTAVDQNKLLEAEADFLGNGALKVKESGYSPAALEGLFAHAETLHPEYKQHIDQLRAAAQNPDSVPGLVDQIIASSAAATKEGREQKTADATNAQKLQETATSKRALAIQELTAITDPQGNITDPDAFAKWQQKYREIAPAARTPQAISQFVRSGVPAKDQPEFDVNSYKAKMGLVGNSEYDQFLARYAQSLGKTPATLTPAEGLASFQKFAEFKQDPVMRQNAIAMKQLSEAQLRLSQGLMPTQDDIEVQARALLNHTMSPTQFAELRTRQGGTGAKVFTRVMQLDPNFSLAKAEGEFKAYEKTEADFTSGKESGLVRSNNNAIEHLALLDKAREALKNGDIPSMNAIANWFGVQTGSDLKTVFDHIGQRVGDEVTKAFIPGGGGQSERMAAAGGYNSKMGDQQLRSNIQADIKLMDSQQRHLVDQYKRGTYGQGGQQLFTPEAMGARDRLMGSGQGSAALPQGAGKAADEATISQFLGAAGNDKDKARQMLSQYGWKIPAAKAK